MAYHSTPRRHREAIQRYGLLPSLPSPAQFYGVYVYRDDYSHPTRAKGNLSRSFRCHWSHAAPNDLWRVAYIGPLCGDQFVENGLVLFDRPEFASLVSHLS